MKKCGEINLCPSIYMRMTMLLAILSVHPLKAEIIGPRMDRVANEEQMVSALNAVTLTNKDGVSVPLRKYIGNGKPTLITLWERGCINCLVEMRGMEKIAQKCPSNWNILYVSIARDNIEKDHIRFDKYKLPWTLYHLADSYFTDASQVNLRRAFFGETQEGIAATPLHYLVSKTGAVDAIVNAKLDFENPTRLAAFCEK